MNTAVPQTGLDAARLARADGIARESLAGLAEEHLLAGAAARLLEAGLELTRVVIATDTLHPVIEGVVFRWHPARGVVTEKYDRVDNPVSPESWSASPFFQLYDTGGPTLRRRLEDPHYVPGEFPVLETVRGDGGTDYLAVFLRFGDGAAVGDLDAFYGSFVTGRPGGFTDAELAFLESMAPLLALGLRNAAVTRITAATGAVHARPRPQRIVMLDRGDYARPRLFPDAPESYAAGNEIYASLR
jgi:adenylate cyclase